MKTKRLCLKKFCISLLLVLACTLSNQVGFCLENYSFTNTIQADTIENRLGVKSAQRLHEFDEYKNTLAYQNNDGTKSIVIFQDDICYEDENGSLREKDLSLIPTLNENLRSQRMAYQTASSNLTAYYPTSLCDNAVLIQSGNYQLSMRPATLSNSTVTIDNRTALYYNVYGLNNSIAYRSTYSGMQYQIILNSAPNTFSFDQLFNFGEGTPVIENNCITISMPNKNNPLILKPTSITDSAGYSNDCLTLTMQQSTDGNNIVTIQADPTFFTASEIVYPVTLTVSISDSIAANYITSASVYSNEASSTHGSLTYNDIGYNSTKGIARTYLKFDLSPLNNIQYDNILSACYQTEELTQSSGNSVAEVYFVKSSWSESSITWNNKPDYYGNEKVCTYNIANVRPALGQPIEYTHDTISQVRFRLGNRGCITMEL